MKRIIALIILINLAIGISTISFADTEKARETNKMARFTNTESVTVALAVKSGKAVCRTDVSGKAGTSKITITMNLQKKNNGSWNTIRTWSGTKKSRYCSLSKSENVGRGTYRVKSVVVVYKGSSKETITKYSVIKQY